MLQQLEIHNIALIEKVSIDMGEGLNVMTGETGAGKSIIIDSINAILGERLSKDLIRTGKDKAMVEAVFHVDNSRLSDLYESLGIEPEEDGTLILSREFSISGKNTCRVNGKMVTVSILREIGQRLIDVHGQHDNQSLLRTESHIDLLDSFGGEEISALKQKYLGLLSRYKEIKSRLKGLAGDRNERERKIDLLKYQIDEIKKAKLKKGEDEELSKQRLLLGNAEKVISALSKAYEVLFSGSDTKSSASDGINDALSELNDIARLDEKYSSISKKLEEISYQLDDAIEEVRKERDCVEYNPDLLEHTEERIDLIYKLKKKYGNTIEDVLEYCKKTELELDEIIKSEEIVADLRDELDKLSDELYKAAKKINLERVKAAQVLENKISEELDDLEMKKSKFKVSIEFDDNVDTNGERKFTQSGLDKVEFLISANVGEPLKSLAKIASGGEMSRVMLAIKTILADVDSVPTLIFDEIDIGISGRAAQKVGEKLSFISKNHQVLCVTHLAQIASMSDSHYLIEKTSSEEATQTKVDKLGKAEVKNEIARILGGANISNITLKHAEEMLENSRKFKKSINK
ncbi:MAG: DNA repair protein RecN [Clostridia bacterium]|nr:DNA repair protein RecN [Clostridia bacterium]